MRNIKMRQRITLADKKSPGGLCGLGIGCKKSAKKKAQPSEITP